jgi:hypothetical protein
MVMVMEMLLLLPVSPLAAQRAIKPPVERTFDRPNEVLVDIEFCEDVRICDIRSAQ